MKKKILLLIGVTLSVINLCGCSETKENVATSEEVVNEDEVTIDPFLANEESTTEPDTDDSLVYGNDKEWKTGVLTVDGKSLDLPCKYSDIESLDYKFKDDLSNEILGSKAYSPSELVVNDEGREFYISFVNTSDKDKNIIDCEVCAIEFNDSHVLPDVVWCNGLTFGMTYEEVVAIMGKPNSNFESDDLDYQSYEWFVSSDASWDGGLEVAITNGVVSAINYENLTE